MIYDVCLGGSEWIGFRVLLAQIDCGFWAILVKEMLRRMVRKNWHLEEENCCKLQLAWWVGMGWGTGVIFLKWKITGNF